jgi:archaeosine synthase beta-subunit
MTTTYPATPSERDRFVVERRGARREHDPWRYQGLIVEDERGEDGTVGRVATVLLTGRECPWRCAMCDLWMFTTTGDTPRGAIPAQISAARTELPDIPALKLYNAGSFFDPRAVPEADYDAVADALTGLSRVIVESHPALVGTRVDRFLEALEVCGRATLEVAMGLETAHPSALERLNKHITVKQFREAAKALLDRGVSVRVFLLISPPFIPTAEQDHWLARSIDAAFDCGASVISLVPTRSGNGTLEALGASAFIRPTLDDIERSLTLALNQANGRGRVFVDLWDLDRFASYGDCLAERSARLHELNITQQVR